MSDAEADEKPIRILIIDGDAEFANAIKKEFAGLKGGGSSALPKPIFAEMVRESQSLISDRDFTYAGVFVNPAIGTPQWLAVVRCVNQYRQGVPTFVIFDEKPKMSKQEAIKLGIHGFLKKPLTYQKMVSLVGADADEEAELPEGEESTEDSAPPPEQAGPPPEKDDDFAIVELSNMIGRVKSLFDLYVKLSNGKYVKVLNSGDVLSRDRVESYKAKGVAALYISKKAQGEYLAFCDNMVAEMLKDSTVSAADKTTHVASQGQNTLTFLKNSGFSEESMKTAQQYVNNTTEMVNQIGAKSDLVKSLLNDVASYDHSIACTTIAGLLMKHIGAQSPAIFNAIGIACFLHDIALLGQPQVVIDEIEEKMTPEQKAIFYAHPEEGAKLIKKMKAVPPIVVKAVEQHHLRANKGGFPKDKAVDEVNRMAELIGICEDFVKLVKKRDENPSIDPVKLLMAKGKKDYSEQLFEAFVRTFEEK